MKCKCGKNNIYYTNVSTGECKIVCEKNIIDWDPKKSKDSKKCDMEKIINVGSVFKLENPKISSYYEKNNYIRYFRSFNLKINFFIEFKKLNQFDFIQNECRRLAMPTFGEFGGDISSYCEYLGDLTKDPNKIKDYYLILLEKFNIILSEMKEYIKELDLYTEPKKTMLTSVIDSINNKPGGYFGIISKYPMLSNIDNSDSICSQKKKIHRTYNEYLSYKKLFEEIICHLSKAE